MHSLKYLGLIKPDGTPTEKLPALVKSEGAEYQKVLRDVLLAAYPFFRSNSLDVQTATTQQLNEEFGKLAAGDTVRKRITFFIPAIKDAGFTLSPYLKEPGKRGTTAGKTRRAPRANGKNAKPLETLNPPPHSPPAPPPAPMPWHELLLSKFPSFDPTWPDEVKTKWFESFNDLMQRGQGKVGLP